MAKQLPQDHKYYNDYINFLEKGIPVSRNYAVGSFIGAIITFFVTFALNSQILQFVFGIITLILFFTASSFKSQEVRMKKEKKFPTKDGLDSFYLF